MSIEGKDSKDYSTTSIKDVLSPDKTPTLTSDTALAFALEMGLDGKNKVNKLIKLYHDTQIELMIVMCLHVRPTTDNKMTIVDIDILQTLIETHSIKLELIKTELKQTAVNTFIFNMLMKNIFGTANIEELTSEQYKDVTELLKGGTNNIVQTGGANTFQILLLIAVLMTFVNAMVTNTKACSDDRSECINAIEKTDVNALVVQLTDSDSGSNALVERQSDDYAQLGITREEAIMRILVPRIEQQPSTQTDIQAAATFKKLLLTTPIGTEIGSTLPVELKRSDLSYLRALREESTHVGTYNVKNNRAASIIETILKMADTYNKPTTVDAKAKTDADTTDSSTANIKSLIGIQNKAGDQFESLLTILSRNRDIETVSDVNSKLETHLKSNMIDGDIKFLNSVINEVGLRYDASIRNLAEQIEAVVKNCDSIITDLNKNLIEFVDGYFNSLDKNTDANIYIDMLVKYSVSVTNPGSQIVNDVKSLQYLMYEIEGMETSFANVNATTIDNLGITVNLTNVQPQSTQELVVQDNIQRPSEKSSKYPFEVTVKRDGLSEKELSQINKMFITMQYNNANIDTFNADWNNFNSELSDIDTVINDSNDGIKKIDDNNIITKYNDAKKEYSKLWTLKTPTDAEITEYLDSGKSKISADDIADWKSMVTTMSELNTEKQQLTQRLNDANGRRSNIVSDIHKLQTESVPDYLIYIMRGLYKNIQEATTGAKDTLKRALANRFKFLHGLDRVSLKQGDFKIISTKYKTYEEVDGKFELNSQIEISTRMDDIRVHLAKLAFLENFYKAAIADMTKTSELAGNTDSWAKSLKKKVWGESAQEAVKNIKTKITILKLEEYKTTTMKDSLSTLETTMADIQVTKESSGIDLAKIVNDLTEIKSKVQATRDLKDTDGDVNAEFERLYLKIHDENSWFNLSILADLASRTGIHTFMDNLRQGIQFFKDNGIIIGGVGGVCLLGILSMTPLGTTVKEITTRIVIPTTIIGSKLGAGYVLVSLTRAYTDAGMVATMYELSTFLTTLRIPRYKGLADINEVAFNASYKLAMENIPNILKSEGVRSLSSLSVNTTSVKNIPGIVDNFNNIVAVYQLRSDLVTLGYIIGAITLYLAYDKFGNIKCWWGKTEAPALAPAPVAPAPVALAPAPVAPAPVAPPAALAPAAAPAPVAPAVAQRVAPAVAQRVAPAVAQRVAPAVVEEEEEEEGALDLGLPDGEEFIGDDMEGGEKKMKRSYGTKKTKSKKTKSKKTKTKKMKSKKIHNKKKGVHKTKKGGRNKIIKPVKIHKKSMRSVKK